MHSRESLLERLEAIGRSLAASGHGRALLGLGSVGREMERLDEYSDLDFFVIVEEGYKQAFINNIDWLERVHPVGYAFMNTEDGYKLMFLDGILCEFAIFEEKELRTAVYAPGRIVWQAADFDPSILKEEHPVLKAEERPVEWLVGETLTNLYVGMSRFRRGERLTAMRFIQVYALDRVVELAERVEIARPFKADLFARERRLEQRYPHLAGELPALAQGYEHTPQSALAILDWLSRYFEVNPVIRGEIIRLCEGIDAGENQL